VLLDFDRTEQAANSSASIGLSLSGTQKTAPDWPLKYTATAAQQSDHGDNPLLVPPLTSGSSMVVARSRTVTSVLE